MSKAVKSGQILETTIKYFLHDSCNLLLKTNETDNCKICDKICSKNVFYYQYSLEDIYGKSCIDFFVNILDKNFYIEVKNQKVPGSVDQKFPYYIENVRKEYYSGELIFVLCSDYIRQNVLNYLNKVQNELPIHLVFSDKLLLLKDILFDNKTGFVPFKYKPVFKYAGGKKRIMSQIIKFFPEKFGNYHEFFAGSLSVACELHNSDLLDKTKTLYFNDIVTSLITSYSVIKSNLEEFLRSLTSFELPNKELYLDIRKKFNNLKNKQECNDKDDIFLSSCYYFLNKTCFNGIYRENKTGDFNVPFGNYDNKNVINKDDISRFSNFLNFYNTKLTNNSFEDCVTNVNSGDLVYLDPPYHSSFTSYHKSGFTEQDQIKLKEVCDHIKNIGAYVIISNSNTDFIRQLYKDYTINEITLKRSIGSKSSSRSENVKEVLITSF